MISLLLSITRGLLFLGKMQTTLALLITLVTLTHAALTYKGVDWSSLLIEETAGTVYRNTLGEKQPFETILAASGVNTVRQRVWVSDSSDYNLANNVELAKRAQAAGLNIYLDLHYSDTWADPDSQVCASRWSQYVDFDNFVDKTSIMDSDHD